MTHGNKSADSGTERSEWGSETSVLPCHGAPAASPLYGLDSARATYDAAITACCPVFILYNGIYDLRYKLFEIFRTCSILALTLGLDDR